VPHAIGNGYILVPLPGLEIRDEIGNLVLKANQLRDEAWRNEQEAISKLESLISKKQIPQTKPEMLQKTPTSDVMTYDSNALPIWELAAQLSAQVPDDEWKKLPKDLAQKFDYYQKKR